MMLRARFLRFGHLLWWIFRPWTWALPNGVCRAVTEGRCIVLFDSVVLILRVDRVLCECGKEWR